LVATSGYSLVWGENTQAALGVNGYFHLFFPACVIVIFGYAMRETVTSQVRRIAAPRLLVGSVTVFLDGLDGDAEEFRDFRVRATFCYEPAYLPLPRSQVRWTDCGKQQSAQKKFDVFHGYKVARGIGPRACLD
jgi:hypothetical protein